MATPTIVQTGGRFELRLGPLTYNVTDQIQAYIDTALVEQAEQHKIEVDGLNQQLETFHKIVDLCAPHSIMTAEG